MKNNHFNINKSRLWKMKSLIYALRKIKKYSVKFDYRYAYVTKFGNTYKEIFKHFRTGLIMFKNQKFVIH